MTTYTEKPVNGAYWQPGRTAKTYEETPTRGAFVAQFHDLPGMVATIRSQPGGHCIAHVEGCDGATRNSNHANAVLLAAAPELLDALKWLAECADPNGDAPGDVKAIEHAIDRARAAIAKAEGR